MSRWSPGVVADDSFARGASRGLATLGTAIVEKIRRDRAIKEAEGLASQNPSLGARELYKLGANRELANLERKLSVPPPTPRVIGGGGISPVNPDVVLNRSIAATQQKSTADLQAMAGSTPENDPLGLRLPGGYGLDRERQTVTGMRYGLDQSTAGMLADRGRAGDTSLAGEMLRQNHLRQKAAMSKVGGVKAPKPVTLNQIQDVANDYVQRYATETNVAKRAGLSYTAWRRSLGQVGNQALTGRDDEAYTAFAAAAQRMAPKPKVGLFGIPSANITPPAPEGDDDEDDVIGTTADEYEKEYSKRKGGQ